MSRKRDKEIGLENRIGFMNFEIEFADPEEFAPLDEAAEKLLTVMRELACPLTLRQLVKHTQFPKWVAYQSTTLLKLHDLIETNTDPKGRENFQLTEKGKSSPGQT